MNRLRLLRNIYSKSRNFIIKEKHTKEGMSSSGSPIIIGAAIFGLGVSGFALYKLGGISGNSVLSRETTSKKPLDNVLNTDEQNQEKKADIIETPARTSLIIMNDSIEKMVEGIPTEVPYLIIGGGVAGMSAARTIRANDPLSKILIINDEFQSPGSHTEYYPPYRRTLLSKYVWRRNEDYQKTLLDTSGDAKKSSFLFLEPDSFFVSPEKLLQCEYGGISLLNGHRVIKIDPKESTVTLESFPHKISYKACLIATGSSPKRIRHLEISENTNNNLYKSGQVSYFRSLNDFRNLSDKITALRNKNSPGKIMIIGSGLLGTELTSSLGQVAKDLGNLEVIEVFKEQSHLYNILPQPLSDFIYRNISNNCIKLIPKSEVVSISEISDGPESGRIAVSIKPLDGSNENGNGVIENVDHVVIAAGVEPETSLAEYAGLETDSNLGGFLVNAELLAREGIYVAGDSCSFYDINLGRRRVEHWSHSEESGSIAGHNMVAHVLKSVDASYFDSSSPKFVNNSNIAYDIFKPRIYNFQSSFAFKLNIYNSLEAIGLTDSKLETKTFIATDFYDDDFDFVESDEKVVEKALKPLTKHDPLDMPGVVFYLKNKEIVGILLWNVDDDIIIERDFPSPLRSNIARKILAQHPKIQSNTDLINLASEFDLSFYVNSQFKFLEEYAKRENKNSEPEKDVHPS